MLHLNQKLPHGLQISSFDKINQFMKQAQTNEGSFTMFSPRNIMRLLSSGIEEIRKTTLDVPSADSTQSTHEFQKYLNNFNSQYQKYLSRKIRRELQQSAGKNEELQMDLKINKVPQYFFQEDYLKTFEICRKNEANKRQEELTEYLDQIQVVLFWKATKYPARSFQIFQNLDQTSMVVCTLLQKIISFRTELKRNLLKASQQQLKINSLIKREKSIIRMIEFFHLCKKVKTLKSASMKQKGNSKQVTDDDLLLSIKRKELEQCEKVNSLKSIVHNLESYRNQIKQQIYEDFNSEIVSIFEIVLRYHKQQWRSLNVPKNMFNERNGSVKNTDISAINITVLDQSYFAFDAGLVNIKNVKEEKTKNYEINNIKQEEDEEEDKQKSIIDLNKINKLWLMMKNFDLYDQSQINETIMRFIVKHNLTFNQDMNQYISQIYQQTVKQKKVVSILHPAEKVQSFAAFKNKLNQNSSEIIKKQSMGHAEPQISNQDKISMIDEKLYTKIVKFYYEILKKVLLLINANNQFTFLMNFKQKFIEFIESRVLYFFDLKKISHSTNVQDFLTHLNIIQFWLNQEEYDIHDNLIKLKNQKIDEYLTAIQTNLLVKQLKQAIQSSSFLPTKITSEAYMTFYFVINGKYSTQNIEQEADISVFGCQKQEISMKQAQLPTVNKNDLKIIDKKIIYNHRVYRACQSFFILMKNVQKYLQLKQILSDFQENIDEKLCQIVGFYVWYNQKIILSSKNGQKSLKNLCLFYSNLLFLKSVFLEFEIKNKKLQKTKTQITQCETAITKSISMTPFLMIEQKISQLYESKIAARSQIPTPQSARIIQIIKLTLQTFKQSFPLQGYKSLPDCPLYRMLQPALKLISKNYFGYLINMDKRGVSELRWALPKLRENLEVNLVGAEELLNKKGQNIYQKSGSSIYCLFQQEIEEMERTLKLKITAK